MVDLVVSQHRVLNVETMWGDLDRAGIPWDVSTQVFEKATLGVRHALEHKKCKEEDPPPGSNPPPPLDPPPTPSPSSNAGDSLSWAPGKFFTFIVSGAT